jgi:hypothetical protein
MLNWIEILGYAASVLVAISLTMKSLARLRFLNLLGAILFVAYGAWVQAYPVLAVNGFIVVVNVVYLLKMRPGGSEAFDLMVIRRAENSYLRRFLEFHGDDISRFFPGFNLDEIHEPKIAFILRDVSPVGIVICNQEGDALRVHLDYVIPSHRDFQCAQYFYQSWSEVMDCPGVTRFVAQTEVKPHRSYLQKMGFQPEPALGPGWYVRSA